jgi:folylpolyglutamate synthase
LIFPEERIRIQSVPIGRSRLAKYFFEVYDALSLQDQSVEARPRYLQLWLLVALHTFVREGVEAAILETHHGGEFDATNVIGKPVVTAISLLGMDHVDQLGPSIENIAWHKAGIFKPGAEALSVTQKPGPTKVIRDRAKEKGVTLGFVDYDPALARNGIHISPRVQQLNCSLALAASRKFLSLMAPVWDNILTP